MIPSDIRREVEKLGVVFSSILLSEDGLSWVEEGTVWGTDCAIKVSKEPFEEAIDLSHVHVNLRQYSRLSQHPFLRTLKGQGCQGVVSIT